MTFKIIPDPEFTTDVPVKMPGEMAEQMLTTTFLGQSEDDYNAFAMLNIEESKAKLREIVVAFGNVESAEGEMFDTVTQEDAPELFESLLSQPNVRFALHAAYSREMSGLKGARRGN